MLCILQVELTLTQVDGTSVALAATADKPCVALERALDQHLRGSKARLWRPEGRPVQRQLAAAWATHADGDLRSGSAPVATAAAGSAAE